MSHAEKARKAVLGVELDRDELALTIAKQCIQMTPPPGLSATQALDQLAAHQPEIVASFRRAAEASVHYFHERVREGLQPS